MVIALLLSALMGAACSLGFYLRRQYETDPEKQGKTSVRQTSLFEPLYLPLFCLFLFLMLALFGGFKLAWSSLLGICVPIFLHIGIYYIVLLCLLPLLRRWFSARCCADLWLLPNMLYILLNIQSLSNYNPRPLWVIALPHGSTSVILLIWMIGFAAVLLWQVVSHLRYRRFLLHGAEMVCSKDILPLWHEEQERRSVKHPIPLVVSSNARTPLTIGLFNKTQRLVLPHLDYTQEEFQLIFAHEMRHIQRADTRTKAFLGLCTAVCWFNPLMWIAMQKVSDDLELSCDEVVLHTADAAVRKQYAELILNTAGNSRGYTTCLSAAATSLRYRLKNVINPRKRLSGTLAVGLALFLLLLSMGSNSIALAVESGTFRQLVIDPLDPEVSVSDIYVRSGKHSFHRHASFDEDALASYLAEIPLRQLPAGTLISDDDADLHILYKVPGSDRHKQVKFSENYLTVRFYLEQGFDTVYLLDEPIDLEYIESLLDFDAPDPNEPAPYPPEMRIYFHEGDIPVDDEPMYAASAVLSKTQGGEFQEVSEPQRNNVGGISGTQVTHVSLAFSYGPADNVQILVENWDRSDSYTVTPGETLSYFLELAPYSAHYTVYGTFESSRNTVYEMKFIFDVEQPE